ncbi:MAG: NifU family protein [Alphaproteobacteria bacterium]|nr:NifU family protein [Alphaproteobacteria bacterium]
MFIQTEAAPGGSVMRFYPGRTVLESGSAQFDDPEAAKRSPLASALFNVEGVAGVAFDADFVAVRKADGADWQILKPPILGTIMEHFVAGLPVMPVPDVHEGEQADYGDDNPVVAAVLDVIESRLRPALASEGGALSFQGYDDGLVKLSLEGTRFSQPLFAVEIKIENTLKNLVPQVTGIEFVHEPARDAAGWAVEEETPGLMSPEGVAIQQLLEERINPAVASHGGFISLVDVRENRAYIRLEGGCQGCGMSTVTLRQGVEVEIMRAVPTISEVVDVTDHAAGANPYYQPGHV